MNLFTPLGLFVAFAFIIGSIATTLAENAAVMDISSYLDPPGLMIVFGGTIGATLLKSSGADWRAFGPLTLSAFVSQESPTKIIETLVELGTIARKDGLIALESQKPKNKFLQKGIQMLVDGQKPDVINRTLQTELEAMKTADKHGVAIWAYIGEVAPAMGMIGTLIGLVALLANMDDFDALGTNMSIAVLTTMYGAMIANMLALPLANKLKVQTDVEAVNREIIIEGVKFIQSGGNPRVMADLLSSYLRPNQLKKLKTA